MEPTRPPHAPPASRPPRPIHRPVADWIEMLWETYPERFHLAVAVLPATPFLLLSAIPLARSIAAELFVGVGLLLAGWVALRVIEYRAARRAAGRADEHTCAACGYDLRATPYVCPECGAFATPPPGWRQPPELAAPPAGHPHE